MKKRIALPFSLFGVWVLFAGFSTGQRLDMDSMAIETNINRLEDVNVEVKAIVEPSLISDNHSGDGDIIIYANPGKSNFEVEEFLRYDPNPEAETISKIRTIHIPELEKVRSRVGQPIIIRSASRTYEHEISRGRSGNSHHIYPKGLGAVDVSVPIYDTHNLNKLEEALISQSAYTRISRYKSYLHVDFGQNRYGGRAYYQNTPYGWIYAGQLQQ